MTDEPSIYEAFQAFRGAMEDQKAAYRVTVRWFDTNAGKTMTYEASMWGEVEDL